MGARTPAPASRVVTTRGGDVIRRDASGQVRQVRMNNGTVVYHPPTRRGVSKWSGREDAWWWRARRVADMCSARW
jgi:hypothetical protein